MVSKSIRLCFIGNMLGRNANYITTQGQIVADLFVKEGYQVTCVSSKINRLARMIDILLTLFKRHKNFDVVVMEVYSGLYFVIVDLVGILCKFFKIPLIMVLHGGNLPGFSKKYPRWTKRVWSDAIYFVAPSEFLADEIGKNNIEIHVISNVIDIEVYPFNEREKISPRLIWMRSFHPIYNPEMAIDVLAKLKQTHPQATLTMAGPDKGLENHIKNLVNEKDLNESVKFSGFLNLSQKIKEFSANDIYINTNRIDNMPVSVLEARAMGLPIVATDVGGLPYLIKNGEDGFLVANEDVTAMVEKINILLNDPVLTQKISQKGRMISECSSEISVFTKWKCLIEKILETSIENKKANRPQKITLVSENVKN